MRLNIDGLGGKSARLLILTLLLALASPIVTSAARADDEPAFLAFGVGGFDVNKRKDPAALAGIEYRSDWKFWHLKPIVGVMGTSDASGYIYAGIMLDIFWGRRIVTSFSFAPGAYLKGSGLDLGHVLEFRSQAEISYRFDNRSRLGLAINHLSNASIGDDNPGSEQLVLTYAMPIGSLFGR